MDPLFKVGQKVTIKYRKKSENPGDYPCSYTDEMTKFANRIFTIKNIYKFHYDPDCKFTNYFDGYYYQMVEDEGCYFWSSPMFKETYEF